MKYYSNQEQYHKTKIGWFPKNWSIERIGKIGNRSRPTLKAGPFGSSLKKDSYSRNGYKVYGQEQVIRGRIDFGDYYIDEEKYLELISCEIKEGDILISLVGTIGKVLVVPNKYEKGIINPRLIRLSIDHDNYNVDFVKYIFESNWMRRRLKNNSQGGTMGVLNVSNISSIFIPIPPIQEQKKIAKILSTWDLAIEKTEARIKEKENLKKGLMQKLLTGKVRFREWVE
jgi:type I restriction enzyme S subunit